MVGDLTLAAVDPQTATPEFWQRFHGLRRVRHPEEHPWEPLEPDEQVELRMKRDNPFEFHHGYEISRDGKMLSWLHAEVVKPENPEYETNKHLMWASFYVLPEHRRQGIGSAWLPVLAELMDRHGSTVLGIQTELEPGHAFLAWLGAAPKLVNVVSRLNLAGVDWEMLDSWTRQGAQRSPETRLEIYDGGIPESMWADFAPQMTAMFNTMPLDQLDQGDIVITPERLRDSAERMKLTGEVLHAVLTREPDGVISGITNTSWAPYRRTLLHQWFTGVRTDARGRGLGKWIKAAMLLHLRELHPDLEWVVTDNAQSNGPMLKINRSMGFQQYGTQVDYQISRSDLEKRIRSL